MRCILLPKRGPLLATTFIQVVDITTHGVVYLADSVADARRWAREHNYTIEEVRE
jgi:acyl-CoA hydrolase